MKVLVTGGTGFLGRHLVEKLEELNYEVYICNTKIANLKNIELQENKNIQKKFTDKMEGKIPFKEKQKINFNLLEKIYFFIRRKLESRKKSRKNY